VPAYRLYCVEGLRRITEAHWIAAENDEEAIAYVRKRLKGSQRELWNEARLVARFDS
jgi:hypothetical protein